MDTKTKINSLIASYLYLDGKDAAEAIGWLEKEIKKLNEEEQVALQVQFTILSLPIGG
jgi:hypothetical protein